MLHKVVAQLHIDQLAILLEYVSQWNTNSRTSSVILVNTLSNDCFQSAQRILHHIFASFTPDFLLKLPNMRELLIALLPYTERYQVIVVEYIYTFFSHYDRLNRIAQQSSFIKYIWQQTRLSTIDRR
jgi:U3 small nucleolar RNA-associated protein 13